MALNRIACRGLPVLELQCKFHGNWLRHCTGAGRASGGGGGSKEVSIEILFDTSLLVLQMIGGFGWCARNSFRQDQENFGLSNQI